jgi:hypothetical protein
MSRSNLISITVFGQYLIIYFFVTFNVWTYILATCCNILLKTFRCCNFKWTNKMHMQTFLHFIDKRKWSFPFQENVELLHIIAKWTHACMLLFPRVFSYMAFLDFNDSRSIRKSPKWKGQLYTYPPLKNNYQTNEDGIWYGTWKGGNLIAFLGIL